MPKGKRYNSKARNSADVLIDNSSTKIALDIAHREDAFDECNALVLPNEKRKTKSKNKVITSQRLLSKKKRKLLEKIVNKKKKKKDRAQLLEELAKSNVAEDELKLYLSLSTVQTKGLKRHLKESLIENTVDSTGNDSNETAQPIVNSLKGAKKRKIIESPPDDSETEEKEDFCLEEKDSDIEENEVTETNDLCNGNGTLKHSAPTESEINHEKTEVLDQIKPLIDDSKNNDNIGKTGLKSDSPQKLIQSTGSTLIPKVPAVFVSLNRKKEIQEARLKLPVLAEEQTIVEAINDNPVVIITGETGSGKTTQVPQFLYEAGYAQNKMIGITEPRRVAAISMSKRVAEEMNLTEKEVSYLIRFEGNVGEETKIKFMTDGVLLKEVQNDFLLKKYSVIILDEAHERSVYTDILVGLLTRIVSLRNKKGDPLKLIIMSATLRVDDFICNPRLFKDKPPVMNVESRQFPVTIHFNRRTNEDYVKEALRKTMKIHTQLPDGGILIFLTGQREVNTVVNRLRKAFPFKKKNWMKKKKDEEVPSEKLEEADEDSKSSDDDSDDDFTKNRKPKKNKTHQPVLPQINLDDYPTAPPDDGQIDLVELEDSQFDDDNLEEDNDVGIDLENISNAQPLWVLPLYSLLPNHKQAKVFEPPPEGCRLCVVSTNVAETSLTIPNIRYVVDSGKCKTRLYDKVTGVTTYVVTFISKAAANQRAGRAGRTGPGHCYRLYSSAVFNDQFEQFSEPEIRRKPVDDLLLQMKVMNIHKVVNFPFPTPPGEEQLMMSEKRLCILGALEQPHLRQTKNQYSAKVTNLGKSISAFPVLPRYGKMLALSQQQNLLPYTICMVAALSVQELLIEVTGSNEDVKSKWTQLRRFWAGTGNSLLLGDPMVLIRAVGAAEYASYKGNLTKFCDEHGLREKAMVEIRKLRHQLTNEILLSVPSLELNIDPKMPPPTEIEAKLLRQIVLSGMVDQVAHKLSPEEIKEYSAKIEGNNIKWKYAYKTLEMEDPVFMHSSCVLRKVTPEWVIYQEIYETNRTYMRGITAIEPEWLPKFAPSLCYLNEPMLDPPPRYDSETGKILCHRTGTFGPGGWELPTIEIEYPNDIEGIRWFARFFLEGIIFPKLKKFVPSLLSTPSSINKSWSKLLPRVELMTKLLMSKGVMSKDKLVEVWSEDSKFLLSAYQKWLPESAHAEVMLLWPPL